MVGPERSDCDGVSVVPQTPCACRLVQPLLLPLWEWCLGGGEGSPNPLPGLQSRVSNRSGGFGGVRSEGRSLVMPWGGTWASCARTPSCFAEAVKRELAPGSPVRGTAPGGGSGRSLRVEQDQPVSGK